MCEQDNKEIAGDGQLRVTKRDAKITSEISVSMILLKNEKKTCKKI